MREVSAALLSHLQGNNSFLVAEMWEITPTGKSTGYYTSAEQAISYSGNTYSMFDIKRDEIEDTAGMQVATLQFRLYPKSTDLVDSLTWQAAALNGYFDQAKVRLRLLFFSDWSTQVGAVLLYTGTVAEVEVNLGEIKFTAKSLMEIFNQQFPRNLYQSTCPFLLYDSNCGVNAVSFAVAGTVSAGSYSNVIYDPTLTQSSDYFTFGYIQFTSGDLSGRKLTVESSGVGWVTIAITFSQAPEVGDTFIIYPGCDRTQTTCTNKFYNNRFGGQPYIPVPEVLY